MGPNTAGSLNDIGNLSAANKIDDKKKVSIQKVNNGFVVYTQFGYENQETHIAVTVQDINDIVNNFLS